MILSQVSADMVIEWLRSNFESNTKKVIEKETFWHSYRSFHGNVEEDRSIFLVSSANPFLWVVLRFA